LRPIVPQTPLINQKVVELSPKQVIGLDNNESALFFLYEEQKKNPFVKLYTADLRDEREVESRIASCEIVLHAAAVKHAFLCEESPFAAIHTNILGTQNIIDAAVNAGVERLLLTSSDKAVNPTNVMGTSKLMAERLVTAANARARRSDQIFVSTDSEISWGRAARSFRIRRTDRPVNSSI